MKERLVGPSPRVPLRRLLLALTIGLVCLAAGTLANGANAAVSWGSCPEPELAANTRFQCAVIQAPLDYSVRVPGVVNLRIGREIVHGSLPWLVSLSSRPGDAGIATLAATVPQIPALRSRFNFLFFDQRGTGESGALSCPAVEAAARQDPADGLPEEGSSIQACAQSLGAARPFFTTLQSSQDLELLRTELGLPKLTLYGASYGSKLALAYARQYPGSVSGLILDSVVDPASQDPFELNSLAALNASLDAFCAENCKAVTRSPSRDIAKLVQRLRVKPLVGTAVSHKGKRVKVTLTDESLLGIAKSGDVLPQLRYGLPAAVQAYLKHGNPAQLLRLELFNQRLQQLFFADPKQFSLARYLATQCEESTFPWQRNTPIDQRLTTAQQAAPQLEPFGVATVLSGLPAACAAWPTDGQSPALASSVYPTVPTFIMQGSEDTRSPETQTRAVAAQIAGAQVVVMPGVGRAQGFQNECARIQLERFLSKKSVRTCPSSGPANSLLAVNYDMAPKRFSDLRTVKGLPPRVGRTLNGVLQSLDDLRATVTPTIGIGEPAPGLHGGYAALEITQGTSGIAMRKYSYVRGLQISSSNALGQPAHVRVGGSEAAAGTVTVSGKRVSGRLGGVGVSCRLSGGRLTAC